MALRNIGSTPEGQAAVGPKGLKAIIDGVEEYYNTEGAVKSSLGTTTPKFFFVGDRD